MDFALGQYDVMRQIGKDLEYRRNWGVVVKSINSIEKGKLEYHKEARLQGIMMEFLFDDDVDYSVAESAVDLYLDDPETFLSKWFMTDKTRQRLELEIEEANEFHECLDSHANAIEDGYISDLFIDYGDWETRRARPDWVGGSAIYNSNLE